VALLLIVWFGARSTGLSQRWPDVDRLLGGLVAVACAVMIIAGLTATFALFYGYDPGVVAVGSDWSAQIHGAIVDSQIGGAIHRQLLPALGSIAAPMLPIGMREAFGA
jgi:hypothetical protein